MPKKRDGRDDDRKRVVLRFGPWDAPGVRVLGSAWGPTQDEAEMQFAEILVKTLASSSGLGLPASFTSVVRRRLISLAAAGIGPTADQETRKRAVDEVRYLLGTTSEFSSNGCYDEIGARYGISGRHLRRWADDLADGK